MIHVDTYRLKEFASVVRRIKKVALKLPTYTLYTAILHNRAKP